MKVNELQQVGQPDLEEFAHGFVVKTITAVENDTLDGECFGEVLGGLGLACSSRPSWGPSQVHMNGTNQGTVTPAASTAAESAVKAW